VTIDEDPGTAGGEFAFFSHRIHIEAPPATPEVPLVVTFRIDASQIAAGTDLATIGVFKNGVAVPPCTATDASADPDPCVGSRTLAGDDDVEIVVLTSSASFWTFGLCGNGTVDAGEQCDDGNQADGEGCTQCRVDVAHLIPGTGNGTNCALEWLVPGTLRLDGHDLPKALVECAAGDSSCDFTPGDHACTFHVAMCYGARDPGFACQPPDLRYLLLNQPGLKSVDPADVANRAALGASPANLGGTVGGVCTNRASLDASCALNSACNSGPGKRDGKCRRFVAFAPTLPGALQCSAYASIAVPLKGDGRGPGTRKLQVSTLPPGVPLLEKAPNSDTDTIKLVCRP
jgi:cysteine-rich repeat protein